MMRVLTDWQLFRDLTSIGLAAAIGLLLAIVSGDFSAFPMATLGGVFGNRFGIFLLSRS